MEYKETAIPGVLILEPKVFGDSRGYFFERYVKRDLDARLGYEVDFVQDNQSASSFGVVRGLHFQRGEHAQAKLVSCVEGEVMDVVVDIRPGSPTFGQHLAVRLDAESKRSLFIPRGFAHGYAVLSPKAVFQYKCDNYYAPEAEGGIQAYDAVLGIDWPFAADKSIRSEKDIKWPLLSELEIH